MTNLQKALDFSKKLVLKTGKILLDKQRTVKIKNYKDRQDIVTNIDLLAEKTIIEAIEEKYPTHNIFSEEKGLIDKKSQYTWIIDPLDGTKEYLRKIPNFNTTVYTYLPTYKLSSESFFATNLCWVADGRCEAFINIVEKTKLWDIAAGLLMVSEHEGKP